MQTYRIRFWLAAALVGVLMWVALPSPLVDDVREIPLWLFTLKALAGITIVISISLSLVLVALVRFQRGATKIQVTASALVLTIIIFGLIALIAKLLFTVGH